MQQGIRTPQPLALPQKFRNIVPFLESRKHLSRETTQVTFTTEQLQHYARKFLFLPQFSELSKGTSKRVWTCLVTVQPVLCLGVVGNYLSGEQLQAMCTHLDTFQPTDPL
jgi:hypothetical protein